MPIHHTFSLLAANARNLCRANTAQFLQTVAQTQSIWSQSFSSTSRSPQSLKDLPDAVRQLALMRFLQFPKAAKAFAQVSQTMIQRGGMWQSLAHKAMSPLTKTFSVGSDTTEAVSTASSFLLKNQLILLDYVEEMTKSAQERSAVFDELNKLLDAVKNTSLNLIPIKMTALIDPAMLEKLSRGEIPTRPEAWELQNEFDNVYRVITKAVKFQKTIFIDQEYPHQKKAIFNLMVEIMQRFNIARPCVYATVQATDVECFDLVRRIQSNQLIPRPAIKLVNGAYVNWAHAHGHGEMMQRSKMASFVAYVLIAKYCLKQGIHLYIGTHNPILENLINQYATSINANKDKYLRGQLYGFTTKEHSESLYAIYGPMPSCIDYALRRVVEGAGSNAATSSPLLSDHEINEMIEKSQLGVSLSQGEIATIAQAVQFNVQTARVDIARQNVRNIVSSLRC